MKTNLLLFISVLLVSQSSAQTWSLRANVPPGNRHYAFGAFCNGKAYIGTGMVTGLMSDLWEYDPQFDTWTQKANMQSATCETATFTVVDKVYVSGGMGNTLGLREYDPSTNMWTQKANSPGSSFWGVGFTIGNKGYVYGGGLSGFYEYDPLTNSWLTRAPFPASYSFPFAFMIGNKGYVGRTGAPGFYEYDPVADTWTPKQNFPGLGNAGVGFALNGKGYAGIGSGQVIYEYDPVTDSWAPVNPAMPAAVRGYGVGFASNDKGYFGTGMGYHDFWEFTPPFTTSVNEPDNSALSIYPNPTSGQLFINTGQSKTESVEIYNAAGNQVYIQTVASGVTPISMDRQPGGIYFVTVTDKAGNKVTRRFVKM